MATFLQRTVGPEWFTRRFPATSPDQQTESVTIWEAFLTPRLLYHRLRPSKSQCVLLCYQPNLVSRQFGLVQIKPKCLYEKRNHMCLHTLYLTEDECETKIARYTGVTNLLFLSNLPFIPLQIFKNGGQITTPCKSSMLRALLANQLKLLMMC